jgi:hypothetical protein
VTRAVSGLMPNIRRCEGSVCRERNMSTVSDLLIEKSSKVETEIAFSLLCFGFENYVNFFSVKLYIKKLSKSTYLLLTGGV